MVKPSAKELIEAAGISASYASMILSDSDEPGKTRTPSRPLAIFMFRRFQWTHPSIADLTESQMQVFEEVDPWTPPKERAQDQAA